MAAVTHVYRNHWNHGFRASSHNHFDLGSGNREVFAPSFHVKRWEMTKVSWVKLVTGLIKPAPAHSAETKREDQSAIKKCPPIILLCLHFILSVCYRIIGHLFDMLWPNCQKVVLLWAKLNQRSWTGPRKQHCIKSHIKNCIRQQTIYIYFRTCSKKIE